MGRRSPRADSGSNRCNVPCRIDMSLLGGITYTQSCRTKVRSLTCVTFIGVQRWSSSAMSPLRVGSRCWTITKAIPHFTGTFFMNCSSASSPPADAPMPTIGNATLGFGAGVSSVTTGRAFFGRRGAVAFFSMGNKSARSIGETGSAAPLFPRGKTNDPIQTFYHAGSGTKSQSKVFSLRHTAIKLGRGVIPGR